MSREEKELDHNFDFEIGVAKDHPYYDLIQRIYEKAAVSSYLRGFDEGYKRGFEECKKEFTQNKKINEQTNN